jgi:hypothetical protein
LKIAIVLLQQQIAKATAYVNVASSLEQPHPGI